MPTTHTLDLDHLTILEHRPGETPRDLNATGDRCESHEDLRDLIREHYTRGRYSAATRRALLGAVPAPEHYQGATPVALVRAALETSGRRASAVSLEAGRSRGTLGAMLHAGSCSPENASMWLSAIHGGPWSVAVGDGWAVAMPSGNMRDRLGVG